MRAQIPDNLTFDQAATVPLCLATVATGIWPHEPESHSVSFPAPWEEGGLTKFKGQPALILGGSSSVGQYGEMTSSDGCRIYLLKPTNVIQPSNWLSCRVSLRSSRHLR